MEGFQRNPFFQRWDARVLERYVKYGLRPLPTLLHPSSSSGTGAVTLTTPPDQEVFIFSRPTYDSAGLGLDKKITHPDLNPGYTDAIPFYRPENELGFDLLRDIRASVFFVFGSLSYVGTPELNEEKVRRTGTAIGGSGGVAAGRVDQATLEGIHHDCAKESPTMCADAMSGWLVKELRRWRDEDRILCEKWTSKKTILGKSSIDAQWKENMPPPERRGGKGKNTQGKL